MELHSYAKRKVAKKWSIDQKRQLVEARVSHDDLFANKPSASVAPWKKIVSLAKLDDYNVYFVRKQWSNMVNKYKQYKQNRLDIIPNGVKDHEEISKITQEWEFFEPIHRFMSHKTTNLHSYALPVTTWHAPEPAQQQASQNSQNSNSSTERINVFSSDTNDEYNILNVPNDFKEQHNTDHDFYTKKNALPLNYFADVSNDTQESMLIEQPVTTANGVTEGMEQVRLQIADEHVVEIKMEPNSDNEKTAEQKAQQNYTEHNGQTASTSGDRARNFQRRCSERQLSERDRYYRHKRRFNRRLERRFDAILNVCSQIVKAEYPNIDVGPLMGAATHGVSLGKCLFKSDNDEDSAEEVNKSSTDAEQMQFSSGVEGEMNEEIVKDE